MLEKLPSAIGRSLRRVRPGLDRIVARRKQLGRPTLDLESPAFEDHRDMPALYTADGKGISRLMSAPRSPARSKGTCSRTAS